jgi:hypothetical protein
MLKLVQFRNYDKPFDLFKFLINRCRQEVKYSVLKFIKYPAKRTNIVLVEVDVVSFEICLWLVVNC